MAGVTPELWMVTPAFQRYELTDLCLAQRRELCDQLQEAGVAATCVVVADDENIDIATAHGFHAIRVDNKWLGRRFSEGYRYALGQGATHLMPIGSDSWMHSGLLLLSGFPDDSCSGSNRLSTLRADGRERLDMKIDYKMGFGVSTVYPRAAMAGVEHPCAPNIKAGCDTSTWNRTAREAGMPIMIDTFHALEYTDFKSYDQQTTDYEKLKRLWSSPGDAVAGDDAIDTLRGLYPAGLVDRLASIYAEREPWRS